MKYELCTDENLTKTYHDTTQSIVSGDWRDEEKEENGARRAKGDQGECEMGSEKREMRGNGESERRTVER